VLKRPAEQARLADRQRIQAALFATDRPVLVVPPNPVASIGRRIAIAWRDDRRTIRAVLSALRCLGLAESVHVLAGVREGAPPARLPEILVEHGIAAELHAIPIGAGVFGATLVEQAHALGADMLVMGAYVHHPVRTMVLGGVTRHMLGHADLPVLMRH
jgi:nucleotide-binding universal stress UspA family protein